MNVLKKLLNSQFFFQLAQIATIILFLSLILSWLIKLFDLAKTLPLQIITQNTQMIFNFTVASALMYLFLSNWRFTRRFTIGFKDDFKGDLNESWEYKGSWKKIEPGVLSVSNSGDGGLTKTGSLWENYIFEFETKIINKCSSWIVRGKDLQNYVMFQCREDGGIVPHHRVTTPRFVDDSNDTVESFKVDYDVKWIKFNPTPHNNTKLKEWTKVKIEVRGPEAKVFIAGELVYHSNDILRYPTGRVGFRNAGNEEARFRKVRVRLLP